MINLVNLNLNYVVIKHAKSLLSKGLVDMERQCWSNAQYSRRECIEVVGIRDSINNNELEDKVLTVFKKIECELSPQNLEACHSLGKSDFLIHEKMVCDDRDPPRINSKIKNLIVDKNIAKNCYLQDNSDIQLFRRLQTLQNLLTVTIKKSTQVLFPSLE